MYPAFHPAFECLEKREVFSAASLSAGVPDSPPNLAEPAAVESGVVNGGLRIVGENSPHGSASGRASLVGGRTTPIANVATKDALFAELGIRVLGAAANEVPKAMVIMPDPGVKPMETLAPVAGSRSFDSLAGLLTLQIPGPQLDVTISGFRDAPKPDHKFGPWILAADDTDAINFGGNNAIVFSDMNGEWTYFTEDKILHGPFWWNDGGPKNPPEDPPDEPAPPPEPGPAPDPPDDGGGDGGGFWGWISGLFS